MRGISIDEAYIVGRRVQVGRERRARESSSIREEIKVGGKRVAGGLSLNTEEGGSGGREG